jgi:hypothetical protein
MSDGVLHFLLGVAGSVIMVLFAIIGYFLRVIHADVKFAVQETGKNKGRIELVEQQLNSDVKRIEQTTQLELRNLANTVDKLTISVDQLVKFQLDSMKAHQNHS